MSCCLLLLRLTYYRYAGVEHVYLYDCWSEEGEQLKDVLQPAVDSGFVTYTDWHDHEVEYKRVLNYAPGALRLNFVFTPARKHCNEVRADLLARCSFGRFVCRSTLARSSSG